MSVTQYTTDGVIIDLGTNTYPVPVAQVGIPSTATITQTGQTVTITGLTCGTSYYFITYDSSFTEQDVTIDMPPCACSVTVTDSGHPVIANNTITFTYSINSPNADTSGIIQGELVGPNYDQVQTIPFTTVNNSLIVTLPFTGLQSNTSYTFSNIQFYSDQPNCSDWMPINNISGPVTTVPIPTTNYGLLLLLILVAIFISMI